MVSELKTLIVLDTNKLRYTQAGGISYSKFEFSKEFQNLKSFIDNNNLSEVIHIAVPRIVLQELMKQKIEQYNDDLNRFSQITQRLTGIPNVKLNNICLPSEDFDCQNHLVPLLDAFIIKQGILIIDLPENEQGNILKKTIQRAIERQAPFKQSDTGFKDVIVWESIINYPELDQYDKVILITGDSGFNDHCKSEFEQNINKYISIQSSTELAIIDLNKDYEDLIKRNEPFASISRDYFRDYINGKISKLNSVSIDGEDRNVNDLGVVNYFDSVEEPGEDEEDIAKIIISSIKGIAIIDEKRKNILIKASTYLDDGNGIIDTDFEGKFDE